jgi:short-subunit dehydrogenase
MKGCCLILGAGPGVGRALALEFAKEGYDIALGSRTTAKLRSIVSEVKASTGRRAVAFATDATDER